MPRYRFEQYFATRRQVFSLPSPDGESVYFGSDISGQFNLWRVPSSGGWPQQLTLFERESVRQAAVSPDGERIAFIADPDGNEQYQIYVMAAQGGWPEPVTARPDAQHMMEATAFSPDGRALAYAANSRTRTEMDVYLHDLSSGEARLVCGGGGWFHPGSFSPDGRYLLAIELRGNMDQELWLIDLPSGERRRLTSHPDRPARFFPGAWHPDGHGFYLATDQGRDFLGTAFYDLNRGGWEYVLTPEWDVDGVDISPDGRLLAYTVNAAGGSELHLRDLTTGAELPVPRLPRGNLTCLSFAARDQGRRLFFDMNTYAQNGASFVLDLEHGTLRQVTESMLGNLPPAAFVEPELVYIDGPEGLRIPAWLYRPPGAAKAPAVLSIHGGPEAQEQPTYRYGGFYQYLLSRGIAVLAPNIRGSTGFGSAYQRLIYHDWGGGDLDDIAACARYLQSLPWVDGQRLTIWGGSYGGFATLSAATRLPDLWACACDLVGPSNLVTFQRSVHPHWRKLFIPLVGDPDSEADFLLARSPITYVEQLRCPLMVLQGANDPRVVKAESDQMVERLRDLGRTVEYHVFDDEGHGFAKRSNQLKSYQLMGDFLCRHLGVAD